MPDQPQPAAKPPTMAQELRADAPGCLINILLFPLVVAVFAAAMALAGGLILWAADRPDLMGMVIGGAGMGAVPMVWAFYSNGGPARWILPLFRRRTAK